MPSVLTPPEIRRPERTHDRDEGDHGSGRRPPPPPTDKRTGGNGEGDNWGDRPQGRRGPRERLSQVRMGLFFGLFAVLMLFVALASAFFVTRASGHFNAYDHYINEWLPTALPSVLWLDTAALVLSSALAEVARRSMFREHESLEEWLGLGRPISRRASLWLWATLGAGLLFVAGQVLAWKQLYPQYTRYGTNPSTHFFYIITVAHAAHVAVGLGALIYALFELHRSRQFATRQIVVDATVWYWHAMGALWIALFCLLEFCQ